MTSTEALLAAHGLACRRGRRWLFRDLEVQLFAGQRLHLRGANGAGKTSLMRLLAGIAQPDAGSVLRTADLLFVGHANALAADLSLAENLAFSAALGGLPRDTSALLAALSAFGLQDHAQVPARKLSQGQQRRGALARLALPGIAPVWLLDEPHAALDTQGCSQLDALITAHTARGGALLLTGHQALALPDLQALDLVAAA